MSSSRREEQGINYLVIEKHKSNYPTPINLEKGEKVLVGKTYKGEEDWDNWRYCYKLDKPKAG